MTKAERRKLIEEKTGIKALDIQQQGRGALKRTLNNMEKFII